MSRTSGTAARKTTRKPAAKPRAVVEPKTDNAVVAHSTSTDGGFLSGLTSGNAGRS